jgi:hypothetical protein
LEYFTNQLVNFIDTGLFPASAGPDVLHRSFN